MVGAFEREPDAISGQILSLSQSERRQQTHDGREPQNDSSAEVHLSPWVTPFIDPGAADHRGNAPRMPRVANAAQLMSRLNANGLEGHGDVTEAGS